MMVGQSDRRSWDDGAAESAVANFNQAASALEALIERRDGDVRAAMADYMADGVSGDYQAKEARWRAAADQVRQIVATLRSSLESSQESATATSAKAAQAVAGIG
jgi:uncharacterized protein YukE